MKAQATARVDVPTARVFPAWPKESNTSASFCCERLDMHLRQPTVILRVSSVKEEKGECLDMCTVKQPTMILRVSST